MPATFTIEHPVQEETLKEITKTFLGLRPTRNSIPTLVFEPTDGVIQTIERTTRGRRVMGIHFNNDKQVLQHVRELLTSSGTVTVGLCRK
ncbi:hypothetical protein HZB58_03855 [Candidatus Gottesmanbacteria bacterium]|nr:hypothetical protein [Candidatus Gottesmanbacteria bacterium]